MSGSVLLLFNPISGQGKSESMVRGLGKCLEKEGFVPELFEMSSYLDSAHLDSPLSEFRAVVVAGGDGTIAGLLDMLSSTEVPIYNLPTGNQSLFAKEFEMKESFAQVISLLQTGSTKDCFVPMANKRSFFCMVSVGFDSAVVSRIAQARTGHIGNLNYVLPSLRTAIGHRAPQLSLTVDGQNEIDGEQGFLVVANCRQYALSIDFLPEADCSESSLVARFYPYQTAADYLSINLKVLLGRCHSLESRFFKGESFFIESSEPFSVQADGDCFGETPVLIQSTERQIRVLV